MMSFLGGVSDNMARKWVAELNVKLNEMGMCILSTANRIGYHIPDPNNAEDVELVRVAEHELKSKAESIFIRRKSLTDFLKQVDGVHQYQQLSLF